MKSYSVLLVIILQAYSSSFSTKNATNYWENKLNTTLNFQVYTGYNYLMQATSKLIGIDPKVKAGCTTTFSGLPVTM